MLQFSIDRNSSVPAYVQIRDAIAALVDDGTLRPGDRLPPTRSLCEGLGVHRSTVVRSYEELRALGYLDARSGSFTTVRLGRRPPAHARDDAPGTPSLLDWDALTPRSFPHVRGYAHQLQVEAAREEGLVDLDRLSADPALAPAAVLRRGLTRILLRSGGGALDYADPEGWRPLREVLANRMRGHGVAATPDEILVTAGAQHALDLLLRYLTTPGDRVVVEAPTYGLAHAMLRLHGLDAVEVPMREDGMDLDRLEALLEGDGRAPPRLIYTMPGFQNPTGITTAQPHRERLLALAEEHRMPVVEDGYEEEMKYSGLAVMPLKAVDSNGVVIYVGTFSKVIFPGLRVGWIVAPARVVQHLADVVRASALSGNSLAQALAAHFCGSGEFETYLRRIHRIYRGRMRTLMEGLEAHLPEEVTWTRPRGGYTTWLTLPPGNLPEEELVTRIIREGVKVGGGRRYYGRPPPQPHLRLSIACAGEEEIAEGCRRLGKALGGHLDPPRAMHSTISKPKRR
jgi:DNA-binding transcriptional MocR family regulator